MATGTPLAHHAGSGQRYARRSGRRRDVIAYREIDERTRNLMDDVWASTHLSPTIISRLPGEQVIEVTDDMSGGKYLIDNGHFDLPDGKGLRAKYLNRTGRLTEVFRVYDLDGSAPTWQQKAVEPLINIINRRQRRMQRIDMRRIRDHSDTPRTKKGTQA